MLIKPRYVTQLREASSIEGRRGSGHLVTSAADAQRVVLQPLLSKWLLGNAGQWP